MVRSAIAFLIFLVGFYGLIFGENIIKSIISLNIIQTSLILFFINFARGAGEDIPILEVSATVPVDPLPQALMITAIVIGASVTALSLMLTIKLFHYYGTLNWKEIFNMRDTIR